MATFERILLSASVNGKPIKIASTSTPGTLVHTAVGGTNAIDEVYLWVTNTDTSSRKVWVEWGGTTNPDHRVCNAVILPMTSPPIPLITGLSINNGLAVRVIASVTNVLLITGHVNRIST